LSSLSIVLSAFDNAAIAVWLNELLYPATEFPAGCDGVPATPFESVAMLSSSEGRDWGEESAILKDAFVSVSHRSKCSDNGER
jgi:hypothetical protein